jgi:ribosomal protein S4
MRDLYFTSNNPKHTYKSEKFFSLYFRLRDSGNFGSRIQSSNFKKLLILKRFFCWYYFLPNNKFFKKLFARTFVKKRVTFNYVAAFFHLLERNLAVLLVRTQYCTNLLQALSFIKSGFVTVNGCFITNPFYPTKLGDIVEVLLHSYYAIGLLYFKRFLKFKKFRRYYFKSAKIWNIVSNTKLLQQPKKKNQLRTPTLVQAPYGTYSFYLTGSLMGVKTS